MIIVYRKHKPWSLYAINWLLKNFLVLVVFFLCGEAFHHKKEKRNTIVHASEDILAQGCTASATNFFKLLL